jgi:hypothetical protein
LKGGPKVAAMAGYAKSRWVEKGNGSQSDINHL